MTLLIKNARVFAGHKFTSTDLSIVGDKITDIGTSIPCNGVHRVFDAQDKYLLIPGFVDVHVHLRQPGFSYKETIKSGTLSAAKAGYNIICPMPNVNPVPDSVEHLKAQTDIIDRDAVIDVKPYASITKGRRGSGELVDFNSFGDSVCGFSDDGCGVQDDSVMEQAMVECAQSGKIIAAHCEVNSMLHGGYIHDGWYCRSHNHVGISSESEWAMIERDCALALKTGCHYHVCHISTKESVDIIRQAKRDGANVTCETAPHYLILTQDDLKEDGRFKMNPPLRSKEDRQALIEGVIDGTIDVIATDHAPHSKEEKSKGLEGSAMGVVGLETAFAELNTHLVKSGVITMERLIDMMSVAPRRIFNFDGGLIENGQSADLALIDPDFEWTVNPDEFETLGRATPFEGDTVYGKNIMTILRGEIKYEAI